jgi:PPK2 family polyphosphate:nucleotide phosphotransferase
MKDPCKEFIKELPTASCRVLPGTKIRLKKISCVPKGVDSVEKETQTEGLMLLQKELSTLQELLYAQHRHKVLIVLQAMDTAGKDGVIRHVFKGVNPQGVKVAPFKAPTQAELDRDYLWRVHAHVPAKGEIVIFNRSHYEDVLVTRVHGMIDKKTAKKRFGHIRDFEQMLVDEGTTILKFFLHIDKDEQKRRLEARLARQT